MRPIMGLVASALLAASALLVAPALADDRDVVTAQMQELADAIVPGNASIWDKYLDANVIYAEEDDSYKGKAGMLKEIVPLPEGLSGTIKIELLSYHEEGDVAVGLFRQDETEHYYGQTIYAKYPKARGVEGGGTRCVFCPRRSEDSQDLSEGRVGPRERLRGAAGELGYCLE